MKVDMRTIERLLPPGLVLIVGIWVTAVSYLQEPAAAFAFPRIIATVFVVLSLAVFIRTAFRPDAKDVTAASIPTAEWRNFLPGLAIGIVYVYLAAAAVGFYTATAVVVFLLITLYDPAPHNRPATWIRRIVITAGFVAGMYGLFAIILNVFSPREILFR